MQKPFIRNIVLIIASFLMVVTLNSCTKLIVNDYQATAETTITWRVKYYIGDASKQYRWEEFSSNSLVNVNGERPAEAYGEVDDKGLWWPSIPPKPSLDEIEARQKTGEKHDPPERLREVDYAISYDQGGSYARLPTNYSVYRQAVKAYESGQSIKLILRVDENYVEKIEPI